MKIFAKLIAFILHPIFMPLLSIYLLFQLPIYLNYKYNESFFQTIYILLGLNLVFMPLLILYYMKQKKFISSLEVEDVEERHLPYIVSLIFYSMSWFLLYQIDFPAYYLNVLMAANLTVLVLLILTVFKRKSSAHLAGIGGVCGMLITSSMLFRIDTIDYLVLFVIFAGLAAFSRLVLNAHSPSQLTEGFLLGLGMQFIVFL